MDGGAYQHGTQKQASQAPTSGKENLHNGCLDHRSLLTSLDSESPRIGNGSVCVLQHDDESGRERRVLEGRGLVGRRRQDSLGARTTSQVMSGGTGSGEDAGLDVHHCHQPMTRIIETLSRPGVFNINLGIP